jgi:ABC-type lipoprotein release transport system permease subunit
MIKTKSSGQMVFYIILLLLAMLAVFDTQVLSIFRRQKEIGTYIALGYTRTEVVGLFTLEGAMHAVLAAVLATMYGIPFLFWQSMTGITLPVDSGDYGIAIADTMYPVYSAGLVIATICIVLITTTVVSYLPSPEDSQNESNRSIGVKIAMIQFNQGRPDKAELARFVVAIVMLCISACLYGTGRYG